jgi:DNA invertase Pin-like site-specific DNA recombinase
MLELLKEVEAGMYDAVLCMDMDRLGRGNMKEQGLILETFQQSKTKIITPRKTYDLSNEWDEEYTEFETFMARRELKIITRRMQGGRVRSIEEGNYIATRPPYGYVIKELENGRTLEPHPEQAPVVKMIFDMYTHDDPEQRKGTSKIANELNRLGYRTYTGMMWKSSSVLTILKNPVYAGQIVWKKKEQKKSRTPGKHRDTRTRPCDEWIVAKGKHEPIVSMKIWQKAQDILKSKYHVPYQLENGISNPLAGLIRCELCGSSMILRPYIGQQPHIKCYNRFCKNKSSRFTYVEEKLLVGLKTWLVQYKAEWNKYKKPEHNDNTLELKQTALKSLMRELEELEKQKCRLHDLLERGIYDEETYLERSQNLAERIEATRQAISETEKDIEQEKKKQQAQHDVIPKVEHVLDLYYKTNDPAEKNNLLKSVLEKATYLKERWQRNDNFTLVLYPKLPR